MKKVIGFKAELKQPILDGVILSTMRAPWSKPAQKGDLLRMIEGPRFGAAWKTGPFAEHVVTLARPVLVHPNFIQIGGQIMHGVGSFNYHIDGPQWRTRKLATIEGFSCPAELHDFFSIRHDLPWNGQWIYWGPGDPFA